MKKIMFLSVVMVTLLITTKVYTQNTNPVVTDVSLSISGTTVTVNYKVADAEQSTVTIRMEVSSNGGTTWDFNYGAASGNIGEGVTTGTDLKTITWTYSGGYNENFKIRIIADDLEGDQIYYAGKVYNTVTIGLQVWLKENLDLGTMLQDYQNQTNNGVIEKYCYGNDVNNCNTYGGLYQWNEAMEYVSTAGTKGICPTGWHIPTLSEFETLKSAVGNNGNALKEIGEGTGSGTGTNTSGFSALLAGLRNYAGFSQYFGNYTYFWVSLEREDGYVYSFSLYYEHSFITSAYYNKNYGFSVRCIKD